MKTTSVCSARSFLPPACNLAHADELPSTTHVPTDERSHPGHLDATGGDAESIVLDDLKLVTERCAGDREPYRSCVCGQGAYEGLECGQQGLLMLSPAVIQ